MLYNQTDEHIVTFTAKATVIAAGGTGGLFERSLTSADVLEQRSGYGPFTSRLASRAIDLTID